MGNFKRNTLALSVMTGVTALVGGVEPAAANPQTGSFSVDVALQDDGTLSYPDEPFSGDFATLFALLPDSDKSATQSFNLFDTMGGTRELTSVSVSVTLGSGESYVGADVSGNCEVLDPSGNSAYCTADAENTSEFSVVIDLNGQIPLNTSDTNPVTSSYEDSCDTAEDASNPCNYGGNTNAWPVPPNFSITITDPTQLLLFSSVDGSGMFDMTASVGVSGAYGATIEASGNAPSASNSWMVAAYTRWNGDIEVTYDYREIPNGVPEPATLFLLGSGLAGLGLLRRRTDNKA